MPYIEQSDMPRFIAVLAREIDSNGNVPCRSTVRRALAHIIPKVIAPRTPRTEQWTPRVEGETDDVFSARRAAYEVRCEEVNAPYRQLLQERERLIDTVENAVALNGVLRRDWLERATALVI